MASTYISPSLRQSVFERANGRCEYCGIPEDATFAPHEIDHIVSQKHGGDTDENNLALSCALCNKYKGSDIASVDSETGQMTRLYNPRRERWKDHFRTEEAQIIPLSAIGRVTVRLLQLNRTERLQERRQFIKAGLFSPP